MRRLSNVLRHWLPVAATVVVLSGLVYAAVQQALRQGANDPQIQMAHDAADALARGSAARDVIPSASVDVARSLAPFVIVFDDAGRAVASSGLLHGRVPVPPGGVLASSRAGEDHRVTWQPEPGVRVAAVVVRCEGASPGFVVAGRSLLEFERRESHTAFFAGAAFIAALVASLAAVAFGELFLTPAGNPS
jgi:hypothetical protein